MKRGPFLVPLLLCGLTLTATISHSFADDPRDADVDKNMAQLKAAMVGQDQAALIDMMYRPIVDASGGRDNLLAKTKDLAPLIKTTSFEAKKPFQYYSGTDNDYVIIKTHALMSIKGQPYESISFELGVKSHQGGNWQYVDGAGITPKIRSYFFADLPSDVVFPDHSIRPIQ